MYGRVLRGVGVGCLCVGAVKGLWVVVGCEGVVLVPAASPPATGVGCVRCWVLGVLFASPVSVVGGGGGGGGGVGARGGCGSKVSRVVAVRREP